MLRPAAGLPAGRAARPRHASCGRSTAATAVPTSPRWSSRSTPTLAPHILSRLSPDAVRRIREHRAAGHTTILITGVVRPLTRPLQPLFDVIVAAELATDAEGRCTGFLTGPPLVGESRAAWLQALRRAARHRPGRSFAYADSHSDLPMLSAVGNAVAVSPDISLMRAASANQWSIVEWKISPDDPPLGAAPMRTALRAGHD